MNLLRLCVAVVFLVSLNHTAMARAVRWWTSQELLDQSDFAVIATPTATSDTAEHIDLPGFAGQKVTGMETKFTVSGVLKGDKTLKDFVLHYYRPDTNGLIVPNGPSFIYFAAPKEPAVPGRSYLLFLHREADGRYASVVGQSDPGLGISELGAVYGNAVDERQTKLGLDIKSALTECQTIKPGMTRAELGKVFTTEGGLSTAKHRTYVYHDCPYIKVDVDFNLSDPRQAVLDERGTDTIAKISKPYLEWTISD